MSEHQLNGNLEALPNEILYLILSHLDDEPPSSKNLRREPSISMTCSQNKPLKNLSSTCQNLRSLTLPWLFKFSRIHLNGFEQQSIGTGLYSTPKCADIERFLSFVTDKSLVSYIQGVVLYTQTDLEVRSTGHLGKHSSGSEQHLELAGFWRSILEVLNLRCVTTCAPPSTLARLVSCDITTQDAWAFDMELHVLRLCRPPEGPSSIPSEVPQKFDLFHLLPWTHCTLNEGSSLKVYNTYEYYHKKTPSIVGRLGSATEAVPFNSTLTSFEYIAIFPMCQHVRGIMVPTAGVGLEDGYGILDFLMLFPNLQNLTLQLMPLPEDKILEDESRLLVGSFADMWLEFDGCYNAVLGTIRDLYVNQVIPRIYRFVSLDHRFGDMQSTIDDRCNRELPNWHNCGNGHWQRIKEDEIS